MSLYDDILTKNEQDSSEWGSKTSSIKLLQDHLQIKRTTAKSSNYKSPYGSYHYNRPSTSSSKIDELPPPPVIGGGHNTLNKGSSLLGGDWDINQEYDPRRPNDYERLIKEKNEQREKQKDKSSRGSSKSQVIATRSLGLDYDDDDDEYETESNKKSSKNSTSIGPPPSLMENVEKVSTPALGFEVSSVAAKIMAKMGYREGQGLGREEQGINKALQVEKTSKTQGKIIMENQDKSKTSEDLPITEMLKNPSKVVLLRNMVGPGEVDSELEPETKEECSKYGEVVKCHIYEVKDYDCEEDAVRIFIEFSHVDSAIKALVDLNGRYFGGRIVKASFFDLDRFRKGKFTPE